MMFTRIMTVAIFIPGAQTLKDKRQVLQSMLVRLRRLNIAVAEIAHQEQWQRAALGIAMLGSDLAYLEKLQQQIIDLIENNYPVEITQLETNDY